MSQFLRLLTENDKAQGLATACGRLRKGESDPQHFEVAPESFDTVPGKPFAYWVSEAVRETFRRLPPFVSNGRIVCSGPDTGQDFRCIRTWWESPITLSTKWVLHAKGGTFGRYYADLYLLILWGKNGEFLRSIASANIRNADNYFHPGLTWPLRTTSGLSLRAIPQGCIFGHKGPAAIISNDNPQTLLALLALSNSHPFALYVSLQLAAADAAARSYEVGVIQKTPVPDLTADKQATLARLAHRAWSLKRILDTVEETSHAFLLPAALRACLGDYDPPVIEAELARIQDEIDEIAFELYGFSEGDPAAVARSLSLDSCENSQDEADYERDTAVPADDLTSALHSWAVGVAFGRFDWRLATGERQPPPEPEPFDPLPTKSPGMLPDNVSPFHLNGGILVDDPGHSHDLAGLVESVLERVDVPVPPGIRRWLQRDYFSEHLKQYSKSRRKAPIYWPLATTSGSYTLWVYYPMLTGQTLYTAVNDFLEPKLKSVAQTVHSLRGKTNRSRAEEKELEQAQDFELELIELRGTLLEIAKDYKPNHDDGVQITAAPLWPLFRHKPWQKVLKDTWKKLERGDCDWAHLAMSYWPDRVREKCKTDKSLAIAHGMEEIYEETPKKSTKIIGRKARGG